MINSMHSVVFCIISGLFLTSIESRVEFDIYHDSAHNSDELEDIQKPNQTYDEVTLLKNFDLTYYGLIKVGKPAKEFKVIFHTGWAHSWLPSADCPLYEWTCLLHNRYDSKKSSTYQRNGTEFSVKTDLLSLSGHFSIDDFYLPHLKVKNQTFVEMTHMSAIPFSYQKADGIIGLAFSTLSPGYTPFFYSMHAQKIINDTAFTFYPTRDPTSEKVGRLILGGRDRSRIKTDLTMLPVREKLYWTILMDKIVFGINNNTNTFCENGCHAMIDTSINAIKGPPDVINEMNMLLGAKRVSRFFPFEYMVKCDEIPKLPHVTIVLNTKSFTMKPNNYIQRMTYLGFTLCMSPFNPISPDSPKKWQLGNSFLMQFYTEFDVSKGRIGIAELNE